MLVKFSAAITLLYVSTAVAASGVHTVPMNVHINPAHRNADAITKRYLHKRGITSASPLTSVSGDVMYTVPVGLGTPVQNFNLAIDTGSPTTWVVESSCVSLTCNKVTNRFDCSASSTCQQTTTPFNISYVDGSGVGGFYIAENYTIGSLLFKGAVGLVSQDNSANGPSVDGIMGLWYLPGPAEVTILNVLKNSNALTQPQIGIWLRDAPTEMTAPGGEITFGGADTNRYSGEISYTDCESATPWTLPVGGMTVNGQTINTLGALATLDTGTSLMLFSETISDAINSAIPGAIKDPDVGWFLPCQGNYPITITFGNRQVTIPYTSLAVRDQTARTENGTIVCLSSAMYPTGDVATISNWLIGDAFLKNVYTIFDFSTPKGRIGLASLAGSNNTQDADTNNGNAAASSRGTMMSSLQALTVVAGMVVAFA